VTSTTPSDDGTPTTRARSLLERHRTAVGGAAAVVCAVLAVVWLLVVPEQADQAGPLRAAVIRLGHPLCWGLLSVTGVLFAVGAPRPLVQTVAYAALASYGAFLLALLV
jgi:hypothetical protein